MEHVATTADGRRIAFDVTGAGPPLLLVPGNMMARSHWHAVGYVERLAPSYRVIAVDPLGHGGSDRPHDPAAYALGAVVDHLALVLDALDVDRSLVWGYSRGAFLAATLARHHPHRVAALVCGGLRYPSLRRYDPTGVAALRAGDWATFWTTFPVPVGQGARRRFERTNDPEAVGAAMAAILDSPAQLPPPGVPSRFYLGDGEDFAASTASALAAAGHGCAVLPTGGHGPTFAAVDACLAAVEPFLRDHADRAG